MEDGSVLVPTGQLIRPARDTLEFAGRPVDLALSHDGTTLYIKDNRGVVVVDTASWTVREEAGFPEGGGSMHGIVVARDGTVLATTAQNHIWPGATGADGLLGWGEAVDVIGPKGSGAAHATGIALSGVDHDGFVCLSRANTLGVVVRGERVFEETGDRHVAGQYVGFLLAQTELVPIALVPLRQLRIHRADSVAYLRLRTLDAATFLGRSVCR